MGGEKTFTGATINWEKSTQSDWRREKLGGKSPEVRLVDVLDLKQLLEKYDCNFLLWICNENLWSFYQMVNSVDLLEFLLNPKKNFILGLNM